MGLLLVMGACQGAASKEKGERPASSSELRMPSADTTGTSGTSVPVPEPAPAAQATGLPLGVLMYDSERATERRDTIRLLNADGSEYSRLFRNAETLEWQQSGRAIPGGDQFVRALFLDYDIIVFDVVEVLTPGTTYRVVVGEETKNVTLESPNLRYRKLADFIQSVYISFDESTPMYTQADPRSANLEEAARYFYKVVAVEGEWLRLNCLRECEGGCPDRGSLEGWVRWSDDTKILVELFYLC
ncbi:MAG: hypothetical protein AAFW73_26395 [Bacteroidota bacterium]